MIKIFIPSLENKRKKRNYDGLAVLLMDGFKGHQKTVEGLKHILEENKIMIMWFPPHSSDQVQPLDLLGFNLQKFASSRVHRNKHYSAQTNAILRIIEGLQAVSTSGKIIGAWHRAGIYKCRPCIAESVDHVIQLHLIDIDANGNIRNTITKDTENAAITTYTDTTISYVKAEPNELYPKTKRVPIPGMTCNVSKEGSPVKAKIGLQKQISEGEESPEKEKNDTEKQISEEEESPEKEKIDTEKQNSEEESSIKIYKFNRSVIEKERIVDPPENGIVTYTTITDDGETKKVRYCF